jgi:AraC family transcriptional regulator of adaptative response / DNA-3-methyladenine glycosylase II
VSRPVSPARRVAVRLGFTPPLFPDNLFGHLAATAVPGVEEWRDGALRRTLRLPHGPGIVALRPGAQAVDADFLLTDGADLDVAVAQCRHLLDLDADPAAIDAGLAGDPLLAPLVAAAPGRRVPRTVDVAELAVRAVLGQQVSTAAARTHAARLVVAHGESVHDPDGGLTHLFPTPAALAGLDPAALAFPQSRRRTLLALVTALAGGSLALDLDTDPDAARAALAPLPGVGPWTIELVAMRGLGDPDAFLATDLGIRSAARLLGLPDVARPLTARAEAWRPYRAYAVQHLWATLPHPVNTLPPP